MENDAKLELKKLSDKYRKFLLNNKIENIICLDEMKTLDAIDFNLNLDLGNYLSQEQVKEFNKFAESIKILAKIAKEHEIAGGLNSLVKHAVHKKKNLVIIDNFEELGIELGNMFIKLDNIEINREFMEGIIREEGAKNVEKS
ncbi:MAG: hypothetical protein MK033_08045 [Candidatus Caenarcaniphilales bacterium]|nr:hypothetical protein [Candidatus Caenarcaniphilales bacterium]